MVPDRRLKQLQDKIQARNEEAATLLEYAENSDRPTVEELLKKKAELEMVKARELFRIFENEYDDLTYD